MGGAMVVIRRRLNRCYYFDSSNFKMEKITLLQCSKVVMHIRKRFCQFFGRCWTTNLEPMSDCYLSKTEPCATVLLKRLKVDD